MTTPIHTIPTVAPLLYPKHESTAAYIRQRGRCRLCGKTQALSGALYYDTIARSDPHWRRIYKTDRAASLAFAALRGDMARMACASCAPDGAAPRRAPLVSRHELIGPPEVAEFVKNNYTKLFRGIASETTRRAWYTQFMASHGTQQVPVSRETFTGYVWGSLRQTSVHQP